MKKLFYLASGIILCASFLPKEVNARFREGRLLRAEEARALLGEPRRKCKNKFKYTLFLGTEGVNSNSGVIGRKFGRVFSSPTDAMMFFKRICESQTPPKMMKTGLYY